MSEELDFAELEREYLRLVVQDEESRLLVLIDVIPTWQAVALDALTKRASVLRASKLDPDLRQTSEDDLGNDHDLVLQTVRALYASLAVSIASAAENYVGSICRRKNLLVDAAGHPLARPDWGVKRQKLQDALAFNFDDLEGFVLNKKARLLGNCFKHSDGRRNEQLASQFGGTEGEVIEYENENWRDLIEGTGSFLHGIVSKL